jgi:uncharacterized iron-regulated membrane protein
MKLFSDKKIYQYHSWLGLIGGFFILLISLTGTILTFEEEIDALLNPSLTQVNPLSNVKSIDEVVSSIRQQYPNDKILNMRIYAGEVTKSIRFEILQEREVKWVYVNPYTAQVIGDKPKESSFVRVVFEFHEHLLMGFVGHIILGIIGICLFGSALTGLIYYRKSLFKVFSIGVRFSKSAAIVNADLHKLLGVTALVFVFVMSATGIFFHFEKIERGLGRMIAGNKNEIKEQEQKEKPDFSTFSLDKLLQQAQTQIKGFDLAFVRFPEYRGDNLSMRGNRPESIKIIGKFGTTIDFNTQSGQIVKVFHAEEADEEYIFEHIVEELHFGRYGGKLTKSIYFLGGLAIFVMTITGFFIWWRNRNTLQRFG